MAGYTPMWHYAKVNDDNIVVAVMTLNNQDGEDEAHGSVTGTNRIWLPLQSCWKICPSRLTTRANSPGARACGRSCIGTGVRSRAAATVRSASPFASSRWT